MSCCPVLHLPKTSSSVLCTKNKLPELEGKAAHETRTQNAHEDTKPACPWQYCSGVHSGGAHVFLLPSVNRLTKRNPNDAVKRAHPTAVSSGGVKKRWGDCLAAPTLASPLHTGKLLPPRRDCHDAQNVPPTVDLHSGVRLDVSFDCLALTTISTITPA